MHGLAGIQGYFNTVTPAPGRNNSIVVHSSMAAVKVGLKAVYDFASAMIIHGGRT